MRFIGKGFLGAGFLWGLDGLTDAQPMLLRCWRVVGVAAMGYGLYQASVLGDT
ncbi:hypothetical protein [Nitrospira sp. Kam-Ns4a]